MEWKKYTIITAPEALVLLRTTSSGLGQAEADRRLIEYGRNVIQEQDHLFWRMLQRRSRSALSWIFLIASIATFFSGNTIEALCILLFLFLNAGIEIYQEFHSEKAARLLQHYLVSKARVRRNGRVQEISTHALVPGDIILLQRGDTIPADVRILEESGLLVKEAHISSERKKIEKQSESLANTPQSFSEADNIGFAGTNVIAGSAEAVVVATGAYTALGDIAHKSTQVDKETPFEKNIAHFSSFLVKLLLFGLLVVFILYFLIHGEQVEASDMVIFTLVLAIAVVPEALPALTALALARGSVRLAKKGLVIKRLSAIEDLGSIEVLCVDKTGILTENKLTVTHIESPKPENALRYALLASHETPLTLGSLTDAFDKALWNKAGPNICDLVAKTRRADTMGFDPETRLQIVTIEEQQGNTLILRGAPEEILRRVERLDSFTRRRLQDWISEAGHRGERVLGVATKELTGSKASFSAAGGFTFQGFIAFLDPIKPNAKEALFNAHHLGVQVKIFSGDSKEVVGAVAYAVGIIKNRDAVITGSEFEVLSIPEQLHALENYSVFARFSPTQKSAAVQLLQKSHALGVLGSGILDISSLQIAQVAITAEDAGDIAHEASDILLLDKDLGIVIKGIQESRKVFANILKYVKITLASNFGNFYSITLAALFLPYLPLLPLQILFLNFLSDIPMLAIASDSVDQEKLVRPKDQNLHVIIVTATLFGMVSSFFDLTIFKIFSEHGPSTVQTAWFVFSVITEVLLLYSLRSRRWFFKAERPSWAVAMLSLLAAAAALIVPYTALGLFLGFEKLAIDIWIFIIAIALGYFVVTEIIKRWYYLHSAFFVVKGKVS